MEINSKSKSFQIIGKSVPNIFAMERVTGQHIFQSDQKLQGMLHGKLLRTKFPHAKILNIDTSKAEKVRGVKAVITSEDFISGFKQGYSILDRSILAKNRTRFIGEPIAAVAAIDEEIAMEAIDLIDLDYEILPAVFDTEEAMKPNTVKIHNVDRNIANIREENYGDIEKGFQIADFIFEDRFTTPAQEHAPLEPEANVVRVDHSGRFTCWIPSHSMFWMRSLIASSLGIPEQKVNVINRGTGGDFGGKGQTPLSFISY